MPRPESKRAWDRRNPRRAYKRKWENANRGVCKDCGTLIRRRTETHGTGRCPECSAKAEKRGHRLLSKNRSDHVYPHET